MIHCDSEFRRWMVCSWGEASPLVCFSVFEKVLFPPSLPLPSLLPAAPQVITPPEESIQAAPGDTVRFTCVAIGVPTPIITWRLNWGHIPSSHR